VSSPAIKQFRELVRGKFRAMQRDWTPRERVEWYLLSIGSTDHADAFVDGLAKIIEEAIEDDRAKGSGKQ
jgi:hypothetical protein